MGRKILQTTTQLNMDSSGYIFIIIVFINLDKAVKTNTCHVY